MGQHEPNYNERDYAPDFIESRARDGSNQLLALLVEHHPEQCPDAARSYMLRFRGTPDEPEPTPTIVAMPTEEERIAAWVQKQKALIPEKYRDWNVEASTPSVLTIQRVVCAKYKVSRSDIISTRRTGDLIEPRQVAIYLSRKMTTRSLPYIGGKFGGRDHSTALHAVRKITRRVADDLEFAAQMEALQLEITSA